MIRLESVSKRYPNGTVAVRELSLEVEAGEICVLVGPSDCGKTTTTRMINRLIEPTGGRLYLDGDRFVGVLTPDAISRALRSSIDDAAVTSAAESTLQPEIASPTPAGGVQ